MYKLFTGSTYVLCAGSVKWEEQCSRYLELVQLYEKASKFTAIRVSAYGRFDDPELVCKEYGKRRDHLLKYLEKKNLTAGENQQG